MTRVCIRIGTARWPDYRDHPLAYLVDCVDLDMGSVLVLDLQTDERFEAPLITAGGSAKRGDTRSCVNWTRPATRAEKDHWLGELRLRFGDDVRLIVKVYNRREEE